MDSLVTDPPAGISFMAQRWDGDHGGRDFWVESMAGTFLECLRVLKPGAHALVWSMDRTQHWTMTALEDAGFEIRRVIYHLHGQGFPKSHNLDGDWKGWGTDLKPAVEPWILARAPLSEKTVAGNVLKFGTGGLNIDASRIESEPIVYAAGCGGGKNTVNRMMGGNRENDAEFRKRAWVNRTGRWPANLCLTHGNCNDGNCEPSCPVAELDRQSGNIKAVSGGVAGWQDQYVGGKYDPIPRTGYDDNGGASRFFYCAKPSSAERESGLDGQEIVSVNYQTWEEEDLQVQLRVDTGTSRPRVICGSTIQKNAATEWSTFLFGSGTTAPSLTAIKSITATASGSITESKTLRYLVRSLTSAGIAVANGKPGNGGSPAGSVESSTPFLTITRGKTASPLGVGPARSSTQLRITGNASSPANHPTVKSVALMQWLIRLITKPGGLVLDPFFGSGTTGKAATEAGFRYIGIEREREYMEIAQERVKTQLGMAF